MVELIKKAKSIGERQTLIALSNKYHRLISNQKGLKREVLEIPHLFMEELHLVWDEQAFALPDGEGNWQILSLPDFSHNRTIPVLSEHVATTRHGSKRHRSIMKQIYSYPGFVEVESGDVVIDIGAHVGGFSLFASEVAGTVVAIDPTAKVNPSLYKNTNTRGNIKVVPKAVWNEFTTININTATHPNENSILSPDTRSTGNSFEVTAEPLSSILTGLEISHIDFLKLEAEGAELEILRQCLEEGVSIGKIAVDGTPERNGKAIGDEVIDLLQQYGYSTSTKDDEIYWGEYIVFGRQSD